ncbi:AAA family ATPase [Curtobacterium sp. RRHDQ10]|uniref:AAA family ATPase n=1 Tax=Curtobacterium phyllosphaerae TaxID=3413379 RepID=UPI003BEF528B
MVLVLMCGLSFTGKSTVAGALASDLPAHLTSLDCINEERGLDGGQGIPVEEWAETNRLAHERVRLLLERGDDVVVDDTGSPRFIRDQWRSTAAAAGASFALVWVRIDTTLQRERVRANRSGPSRSDVTDDVLDEQAATFEPPVDEDAIVVDGRDADPAHHAMLLRTIEAMDE